MSTSFAERLEAAIVAKDNPTVMGLDPRWDYLPASLQALGVEAGLLAYNQALLEALAPWVPAVKFQAACYEAFGLAGQKALEASMLLAKELGLLRIYDAKRNDIGSSSAAYAKAALGQEEGPFVPLDADAVTVNAYLGEDGVRPFLEPYLAEGKGVFILVRTSNPSAKDLQDLPLQDGRKVYEAMADLVAQWSDRFDPKGRYSSLGAVVGATWPSEAKQLRARMPRQFFLIPGYGAQGGSAQDAVAGFDRSKGAGLVNASRSLMLAYQKQGLQKEAFAKAAVQEAKAMQAALKEALA